MITSDEELAEQLTILLKHIMLIWHLHFHVCIPENIGLGKHENIGLTTIYSVWKMKIKHENIGFQFFLFFPISMK